MPRIDNVCRRADDEVHLADVSAVVQFVGRVEPESGERQSTIRAIRRIVAHRVLLQDVLVALVDANVQRIDRLNRAGVRVYSYCRSIPEAEDSPPSATQLGTWRSTANWLASMRRS